MRIKPRFILFWLVLGILLPWIISSVLLRRASQYHDLLVTTNRGTWYAGNLESALRGLSANERATIEGFTWSNEPQSRYIVIRGSSDCVLKINQQSVLKKSNAPVSAASVFLPAGFSEWKLSVEEDHANQRQFLDLQWSRDYISSEHIPSGQLYNREISPKARRIEHFAKLLGILARLGLVAMMLWILFRLWNPKINFNSRTNQIVICGLLIMFALRFAGIRYQMQELLHPDEAMYGRMIAEMHAGKIAPSQFLYTTGYFMITAQTEKLVDWIVAKPVPQSMIQRSVAALSAWLSCLMVFLIGRRLFSINTAVVATYFFGFTYIAIEVAHYGIVESALCFFFLLALYAVVVLAQKHSHQTFALAGFCAGMAVGVKQTAVLIVFPFLCLLLFADRKSFAGKRIKGILIYGLFAFLGFFILSPGTMLELPRFYKYQQIESHSMQGKTQTSLFFAGEKHRFGSLAWKSLTRGAGLPLVIAALPGILLISKKSRMAAWLLIPPALVYFILISKSAVIADHYVVLLCPFVAWLAAVTVVSLPFPQRVQYPVLVALLILILLPSLSRTFLLERLLQGVDTRREASEWCYKNIPAGSSIFYETFGPRFLIPAFETSPMPLFRRSDWSVFSKDNSAAYVLEDDITSAVFASSPDFFAREMKWYEGLSTQGHLVEELHSRKFGLLNPVIHIYKISP